MFEDLSQRLLSLLQLTRMALVFTAIADTYASALILRRVPGFTDPPDQHDPLEAALMIAIAAISVGLYGFGMSLNDIADRRRDKQIAAHRPLPSGRVGVFTAHAFMLILVFGALAAAAYYSATMGNWTSLLLAVWTAALIAFYDLAGKFLVAPGLLALGLIRFFHCLIPAPQVPVLWHPLFLLNHVAILSAVCYQWEEKRPPLTRIHWWMILGGLAGMDALFIGLLGMRHGWRHIVLIDHPILNPPLLLPCLAAVAFVALAWYVRTHAKTGREAGQTVMLYGLLWLIVYDAAFVCSYAGWLEAVLLILLFPAAYFSVQFMRWWSKILSLSHKPTFKRART